jgi:hypothetical protein
LPDLPVCDASGHFRKEDVGRVFAIMLWPDDKHKSKRDGFLARIWADVASREASRGKNVLLDPLVLRKALQAEPHPLAPGGDITRWQRGEMAGEQLLWLFSPGMKAPHHLSHKKVVFLMEETRQKNNEPGRRATFHSAWPEFSNVAHLWAAMLAKCSTFHDCSSIPGCEGHNALAH